MRVLFPAVDKEVFGAMINSFRITILIIRAILREILIAVNSDLNPVAMSSQPGSGQIFLRE